MGGDVRIPFPKKPGTRLKNILVYFRTCYCLDTTYLPFSNKSSWVSRFLRAENSLGFWTPGFSKDQAHKKINPSGFRVSGNGIQN
jgi:hypothetical protein